MDLDLKTDVTGIGTLLSRDLFTVPSHQRSYAWTESEVLDLWNDIVAAIVQEPDGYFLGQVVLGVPAESQNRRQVIDGQQRLATVALLFAAVIAILRDRTTQDQSNLERASEYEREFIASKDKFSLERTFRLLLSPNDNSYFEGLLSYATRNELPPEPTRDSHKRLLEAYILLREKVEKFVPLSDSDWLRKLNELTEYVESKLVVIEVDAGSEENAFLIFETLNDRGVQLTPADLLKNLLFHRARNRLAEVQHHWTSMSETLESISDSLQVTQFVRHYWISTRGSVRDRQLYKTIRSEITTTNEAVEFAKELAREAQIYAALTNSDSPFWEKESEREAIRVIGLFRVRTILPVLLAIANMDKSEKRTRLIRQVMKSTVRLAVTHRLGTGSMEEGAGAAARFVREGGQISQKQLKDQLGPAHISDSDFESAFRVYRALNGRQARYLLRALEKEARKQAGKSAELIAEGDESKVNLEHILPKNPAAGSWREFTSDDARLFSSRLGNQVLMLSKANRDASNSEYPDKERTLSESELELTKMTGGKTEWTKADIEERQRFLSSLAVRLW